MTRTPADDAPEASTSDAQIRRLVAAAPPLTDAQRNHLAALLLRASEPAALPRAGAA